MAQSDHELIQQLLARYCFVTDTGSAEELGALFWDDATVLFGENTNAGREAFERGFNAWIVKMRDPVEGLRHVLHSPWIEITGDTASARAYYDADGHSRKSGRRIHLRGMYIDDLHKRDGEWRFLCREIQIWRSMLNEG